MSLAVGHLSSAQGAIVSFGQGCEGDPLLAAGFAGVIYVVQGIYLAQWQLGRAMMLFGWPLAMWLTAAFVTVIRFLSYLDLRIRHEGWEVELRMRAEAARLSSQWS